MTTTDQTDQEHHMTTDTAAWREGNDRDKVERDIAEKTGLGTLGALFDVIVNQRDDLQDLPAAEIVARVAANGEELWDTIVGPALDALERAVLDIDTETSASRQHYIDTGRYLRQGEAVEPSPIPEPVCPECESTSVQTWAADGLDGDATDAECEECGHTGTADAFFPNVRLVRYLGMVEPGNEYAAHDASIVSEDPKRYLGLQSSNEGRQWWFADFETVEEALAFTVDDMGDWYPYAVVDLDTGQAWNVEVKPSLGSAATV